MNLAAVALKNRTTTLVLTAVLFVGGIQSYQNLSRLEDPEFTIKEALVITPYPGASPVEVAEEVTEKIERAVQQLGQLKEVESRNERILRLRSRMLRSWRLTFWSAWTIREASWST